MATTDAQDVVQEERDDSIVTLTLNRPQVLDAINRELGDALRGALRDCAYDSEVRVVVVRGSGRAFCAGDDLRGGAADAAWTEAYRTQALFYLRESPYLSLVREIRQHPKPIIARVHGYALGAGFDVALASDFVIAAESARLGAVFIKRGIVGGTDLLTKHVGLKRATDLLLRGEMIDAREAERLGLVTRTVPDDELDRSVDALAGELAIAPTLVIAYQKHAINRGLTEDIERGVEFQAYSSLFSRQTHDRTEGTRAFREKRRPDFTGR